MVGSLRDGRLEPRVQTDMPCSGTRPWQRRSETAAVPPPLSSARLIVLIRFEPYAMLQTRLALGWRCSNYSKVYTSAKRKTVSQIHGETVADLLVESRDKCHLALNRDEAKNRRCVFNTLPTTFTTPIVPGWHCAFSRPVCMYVWRPDQISPSPTSLFREFRT